MVEEEATVVMAAVVEAVGGHQAVVITLRAVTEAVKLLI